MDLDGNDYPDVAVEALRSNTISIFRLDLKFITQMSFHVESFSFNIKYKVNINNNKKV